MFSKAKLWWLINTIDLDKKFMQDNADAIEQVKQAQLRKYRVSPKR